MTDFSFLTSANKTHYQLIWSHHLPSIKMAMIQVPVPMSPNMIRCFILFSVPSSNYYQILINSKNHNKVYQIHQNRQIKEKNWGYWRQ